MEHSPSQQEEIHLRDYYEIILRRYRLVAVVWATVFVVGTIFTLLQTPMFQATATVQVEESKGQLDLLADLGKLSGALEVATEMEIIKSRTLAEEVVRALGLDAVPVDGNYQIRVKIDNFGLDKPDFDEPLVFKVTLLKQGRYEVEGAWGEKFGSGRLGEQFSSRGLAWVLDITGAEPGETVVFEKLPFDVAVDILRNNTSVSEVARQTNIVSISVEHPSRELAREIVNKLTELYLARNIARHSQEASQMLQFIERQLELTKVNLERGEQDLGKFKSDKGLFVLGEQAGKLIEQIANLETRRVDLQLQDRQLQELLHTLKTAPNSAPFLLGNISLPDPVAMDMVGELFKLLVELRGLRQEYTDENPKVAAVVARVGEVKEKILNSVGNAKESVRARSASVTALIAEYENRLRALPGAERELASLTRRANVNAELYTFLLKKHEEARISQAAIVGNLSVVDPAITPQKPISPKKQRNIVLIFLGGLLMGIGLAFFTEYIDDTIKDTDDVLAELALNSFGLIPYTEHDSEVPLSLLGLDPRAPIQEAFRTLRTNIQFTATERPVQTILCTSALPGEGKTTLTSNIAVTLAQGGARVLLVDCDLRRPQIHEFFGLPNEPGISNVVIGGVPIESVCHFPTDNLAVVTSGVLSPNPAEFLQSKKFRSFHEEAKRKFDFILFDVPPIVTFTDAAIVASSADAVFLVIELRRSRLPAVRQALESLGKVKAPVMGALLNRVQSSLPFGGYYEYYVSGPEQKESESLLGKLFKWVS